MKEINAEHKPFGLCTKEVQEELREAQRKSYIVEYFLRDWTRKGDDTFFSNTAYRAFVPETKKIPWQREDFICKNIYVNALKHKSNDRVYGVRYYAKSFVSVTSDGIENHCINYDILAKNYTLPDGTELYKEVTE